MAVASAGWRFGLFAHDPTARALERMAEERGYVVDDDGSGFKATLDGVTIAVRCVITPGHGGPIMACTVRADALAPRAGHLSLRPKHDHEPPLLRIGDVDFDTCFWIDASSRAFAWELIDAEARRALFAFGPHGSSSYTDGAFEMHWETGDAIVGEIERALAVARAFCRAPSTPYRG